MKKLMQNIYFAKDFEFIKPLTLNRIPTLSETFFSTNATWVFQVKFWSIITPNNFGEFSLLILALLKNKYGVTRRRLSLLLNLWNNAHLILSVFIDNLLTQNQLLRWLNTAFIVLNNSSTLFWVICKAWHWNPDIGIGNGNGLRNGTDITNVIIFSS